VYKAVETRFREALAAHIRAAYQVDVPVVSERPPKLAMGDLASPVSFELAKRLKKAPRAIAQELAASFAPPAGIARLEVAGGGYLNAFFDRAAFFQGALAESGHEAVVAGADAPKTMVEHTSINPNKAAHIGHLRNAVLGDTFVRVLRHAGRRVEVQNYIDNTGVQVADVVLGFLHIEKKSLEEVKALTEAPKFDYLCWDLYARVTNWLAEDKSRLTLRSQTLKDIEEDHGDAARVAEVVSNAIVVCQLNTVGRLGIDYDLLSQESEILHLKFWDAAFEMLKARGAIEMATTGKNAGCWIMKLPSDKVSDASDGAAADAPAKEENPEEAEAKIIVRSTGTVTYVGKDIAYHLWKFGLLNRDFYYKPFMKQFNGREVWVTSAVAPGEKPPVPFGHASEVYNVIDSRQTYPQQVVVQGLRALGYGEAADHLKHFAYNVVALTPRCAMELGYEIPAEDAKKPYIEVSGRKGQGVKADDLLDRLEVSARKEVDERNPDMPEAERAEIAHAVAIGAIRYFLLRFTRNTVIAFDFKDALSFEGETGPYAQYAVVRINGILRKIVEQQSGTTADNTAEAPIYGLRRDFVLPPEVTHFLTAPEGDDIWDLVVLAGSLDARVELAINSQEPSVLTRFVFELAQLFNVFYHKHPILKEPDPVKRKFLLLVTVLVRQQLVTTLGLLGITAPDKM
jgi:arginyl-tRNA synthetase